MGSFHFSGNGAGFGGGNNTSGFSGIGGFGGGNGSWGSGSGSPGGFNPYGRGAVPPQHPVGGGKRKTFLPALIVTVLYGFIWSFAGELLIHTFFNKIWNPLAVVIYVAAFLIPLILMLLLLSRVSGNMDITLRMWGGGKTVGLLIVCLLSTLMLTLILEFLYEIGGEIRNYSPTSYVFVIDDSGSMSVNDPDVMRAEAIDEIMRGETIPYSVYKFSEDAELVRAMEKYGAHEDFGFQSDGEATDILTSLYTVAQDLKDPGFSGGSSPKVLLLSDGESYDTYLSDVMKEFTDLNVSISTVGFGSADEGLMERIAQSTGGVFVKCNDLGKLSQDMHEAIITSSTRTLLTPRYNTRNNLLYLILRILFLTLIGGMIGLTKARGAVSESDMLRILLFTSVQGTVAALLCEILVNPAGRLARLLVNVLWACSVLTQAQQTMAVFPGGGYDPTYGLGQEKKKNGRTNSLGGGDWGGPGNTF